MKHLVTKSILFLAGITLLLTASCINQDYDLNKGLDTSISIPGNHIALPVGDLTAIPLDSLLKDMDDLLLPDGVYGFTAEDTLDPIMVNVDPIRFAIDPIDETFVTDIRQADFTHLSMGNFDRVIRDEMEAVTIAQINDSLPVLFEELQKGFTFGFDFDEVRAAMETLHISSYEVPLSGALIDVEDEGGDFSYTYKLPQEVHTIHTLYFGNRDGSRDSELGQLFTMTVEHPKAFVGKGTTTRSMDFSITFPAPFHLALDPTAYHAECYQMTGTNTLTVTAMPVEDAAETTQLQFYVYSAEGLDDLHTGSAGHRVISANDVYTYGMTYHAEGTTLMTTADSKDDYTIRIRANRQLGLYDALCTTEPIAYHMADQIMEVPIEVDDLDMLKSVGTVHFNADASRINLSISSDFDLTGMELAEGCVATLQFPANYHISKELSTYPSDVVFDETTNTLTITRLKDFLNSNSSFALESVDIDTDIVDGKLSRTDQITFCCAGERVELASWTGMLQTVLARLGEHHINISTGDISLQVENVDFVVDNIEETFSENVPFDVKTEISVVKDIYNIWPKEPITLTMDVDITGMESLDEDLQLNLALALPGFVKVQSSDPSIRIDDDTIRIQAPYRLGSNLHKEITVTHFDFADEPGGSLPVVEEDGKSWLVLADSVSVNGSVHVPSFDMDTESLPDELSVNAHIAFSEIEVGTFSGILQPEIDPVVTDLDLGFGESLDFLKDENSTVVLDNPQIMLDVTNTIGVPVSVQMLLEGRDATGTAIAASVVNIPGITIAAATYDEANRTLTPVTTHLIISGKPVALADYDNYVSSNLCNLLASGPENIHIEILPSVDATVPHHVDLRQALEIDAAYKVVVPFSFEDVNITYNSDVNLDLELDDYSDIISNAAVNVKMNIRNSIPFGLDVNVVAKDEEGRVIDDIVAEPFTIAAGDGSAISRDVTPQQACIALKCKSGDMSRLSLLQLAVSAQANSTVGAAALKPEQGILCTDIVLELDFDINTDLDEL